MSNGWYQLERGRRHTPMPCPADSIARRAAPPAPKPPAPVQCETPAPKPTAAPPAPEPCPDVPVVREETRKAECPPLPVVPEPPACVTDGPKPEAGWEPAAAQVDPYGDRSAAVHSQTVGPDGPVVLQDLILHETLDGFVHEKTVERAVHVKGWGALGCFTCERDMSSYTMLPFLQRPGDAVRTASRFSLAVSNKGTPDTSRNVRGFSTKFYTDCGVFDLLCNHLPVFSVRDAIRFPESIKALLPSPKDNLIDPRRFWDFVARAPESTAFVTWLYSDVGTIKSLRRLRAYGVNTYVWKNGAGERRYVKYHWLPKLGSEFITAEEAARLACQDPDYAGRDLRDAIARGDCPVYELNVQLMEPADAERLPYDPLDDTKVWSREDYPLVPVGRLTLDRNPDDYVEQVEKLAFSPSNLLEGAELSNDKMLQGRSFVYWDAQRYRLGPGFRKLPVNAQKSWEPDGQVSSGLGVETAGVQTRTDIPKQDDFTQAGEFYRSLSPEWQAHLAANLGESLAAAPEDIRRTVLSYLWQADEDYGRAVSEHLN